METLLEYFAKGSGLMAIFYCIYYLLLRKETFFVANRGFLLAGLFLAMILPLITFTSNVQVIPKSIIYGTQLPSVEMTALQSNVNWLPFLGIIYLFGMVISSLMVLIQLLSLRAMVRKHNPIKSQGFILVETHKPIAPFSFFKYIFYNPSYYSTLERNTIIRHEKSHGTQWHTFDVLLAHLSCILFWANPFCWLYKKCIKQNLEFLADASATRKFASIKDYQYTLLKVSGTNYGLSLTNTFYTSLIKKRIVMLHKSRSRRNSIWKLALVLPFLFAFVLLFNTKVVAQQESMRITDGDQSEIRWAIDKGMSDDELTALRQEVKDEIGGVLKLSGIKRNTVDELIKIKITYTDAKGNSAQAAFDEDEGIPDIQFGSNVKGGIFINSGNHKSHWNTNSGEQVLSFETEKDGDKHSMVKHPKSMESAVWVSSGHNGDTNIVIEEVDGKRKIKRNGNEISEAEFETMQKESGMHEKHIMVRRSKHSDGEDKNVFILKDSDNEEDVQILSDEGNGFLFIDTESGEQPLIYRDGIQIDTKTFKMMSSNAIERIEVFKGKAALEKYGDKAKDGVIEITSKKDPD